MNITIEFREPTAAHCKVAVFVNDALTGVLTLRQDELVAFQDWLSRGPSLLGDHFTSKGDPGARAGWSDR